jgi:hypothetical protein
VNAPATSRRPLRLRRQAVVGLIAGAAALMAATPAHAAPGAHRHAGPRHAIAVAAPSGCVRSSYPVPRHRHPDAAKRPAVAPASTSKRDGGQSELAAVSSASVAAVASSSTRWSASSAAVAHAAGATCARGPPVRQ